MNPTLKPLLDRQAAAVAGYPKVLEDYKSKEPELLKQYEEALAKAKADKKPEPKKPAPPGRNTAASPTKAPAKAPAKAPGKAASKANTKAVGKKTAPGKKIAKP